MGRAINIPARSFNRKYDNTKTLLFRSKAITKEPNFCDRIITFDIRSLFADEIRFLPIIAVVDRALFLQNKKILHFTSISRILTTELTVIAKISYILYKFDLMKLFAIRALQSGTTFVTYCQ